ncbi:MAG: hypothetical protein KDC14_10690 [Planctomycetes bacterium]|nr:hypothetical protein [Planctomycetota bacterium]
MTESAAENAPTPLAPPTRGNLLLRFACGGLLAVLALWLPVDRLIWSRATAENGVFEDAIVFAEGEQLTHAVDAGGGDGAVTARRRTVQCRYADGRETLSFIDESGLMPGDAVPVAYLPSEPQGAVRAEPGTSAFGLYFATQSWIVDAALWPIGLVLALASLANLAAMARTPRR